MVFIAPVAGQIGSQTDPPYSASKAANINFAQCLAKDMAQHGVRVNTVKSGYGPDAAERASLAGMIDSRRKNGIPMKIGRVTRSAP